MTTYYAVADANGLISHELEADNLGDAIRELKAAIESGDACEWICAPSVDLEEACDVDGTNRRYNDVLDDCKAKGAEFEWGDNTSDSWDIWSFAEQEPWAGIPSTGDLQEARGE